MKHIPLKPMQIERFGDSVKSYLDVIRAVVNRPLNQGYEANELRQTVKLLDKIEAANGSDMLDLEDAEYELFRQKLATFKWTMADKAIVQFLDDMENPSDPRSR